MAEKITIVINGAGGAGKDTLCAYAQTLYPVRVVSSITPIKDIAVLGGWDGKKDEAGRLLLVELKKAFVAYNDLPLKYLLEQQRSFLNGNEKIMFVHIREAHEIDKFKRMATGVVKTMLIRRDTGCRWHNDSDAKVEQYAYDYYFDNNADLETSYRRFARLLADVLAV